MAHIEWLEHGFSVAAEGETLWVQFVSPAIVRVRRFTGDAPPESPLHRYGFIQENISPLETRRQENDGAPQMNSELLAVSLSGGLLSVRSADGRELLAERQPSTVRQVRFKLAADERFLGLGDQTRARIEHRGTQGDLWVRNVESYIPVPLLLSTRGVGLLFNTTRRLRFDLGTTSPDWYGFDGEGSALDYYILYGPTPAELLQRYTDLTGKPPLPPRWAFGLWFLCRTQADAREFMDDCYAFRRERIPCDAIGLEPGWMSKHYDYSLEKDWHPEHFPVPRYARYGRHNFISAARRMGYKPGLWLCCDYDFSYEEERRLRQAQGMVDQSAAGGYEQDANLTRGVKRLDPWTKPEEPWFKHLTDFVNQGVEWFKQDGSNQVLTHPDRLWGNGMRDDEMHNLYPLLYAKQMFEGFRAHTGRRPFVFTVAGWAGLQRYAATWTGDTGGEEGPLGGCLNLSLSGHGMVTVDMEVTTVEGIHFGFLLPWAQLNSWNYWRHPWLQGDELKATFTEYAHLRYRLIPYLYHYAREASRGGIPLLRAMPLQFPNDTECFGLIRQYMLGPDLLVGAFTRRVYLPAGEWYDYWTGQKYAGPQWIEPDLPPRRGGPLFVRAGAIVPLGPVMDYVGQKVADELCVQAFLGAEATLNLYEDDGLTYAYLQDEYRTTAMRCAAQSGLTRVAVEGALGSFVGAPDDRLISFQVYGASKPQRVLLNGAALREAAAPGEPLTWQWDEARGILSAWAGKCGRGVKVELALLYS